MSTDHQNLDFKKLRNTILQWLQERLSDESFGKISTMAEALAGDAEDWEVYSSFSAVPRYTGKSPLKLTDDELKEARNIRTGWDPSQWSVDQLARTLLLLSIAERDKDEFFDKLEKLFISSDMGEAEALYQSLPVLPYPDELKDRAAEGIRSNITSVFTAVAQRNPYPADFLDEDAWNQVVLKSLFVQTPLYLIIGIDRRANAKLADILVEYAHERWSAGREVSPELWRPVGPFIDEPYLEEIEKVLNHKDALQRQAAVLALSASTSDAASELIKKYQDILHNVHKQKITWHRIGEQYDVAR